MIRVVVTGSESTGKTTLARALADHYEVPWSPESAREFVDREGRRPTAGDVEAIARGQLAVEERAIGRAGGLVIHDTDLLSTAVYARHYFGACPHWVERSLAGRRADLYLLAGIDVPWSSDGGQRDRGDRRAEMQALFRRGLEERGLPFVDIRGSRADRLRDAIAAIDRLREIERSQPG